MFGDLVFQQVVLDFSDLTLKKKMHWVFLIIELQMQKLHSQADYSYSYSSYYYIFKVLKTRIALFQSSEIEEQLFTLCLRLVEKLQLNLFSF